MAITRSRVLYAEDEDANRKLMQFRLQREGVICDTAEDGFKAMAMFNSREYDLVILDQYMPGMNGDEVAKKIRSNSPDCPLIAITSDDSQVPLLREAGFHRIFLKPLRGEDYIATILSYL